jgi:hypothetical protein
MDGVPIDCNTGDSGSVTLHSACLHGLWSVAGVAVTDVGEAESSSTPIPILDCRILSDPPRGG